MKTEKIKETKPENRMEKSTGVLFQLKINNVYHLGVSIKLIVRFFSSQQSIEVAPINL